jgi:hypothetical protein
VYVTRSTWYPILGKERELRSLAEEYIKDRQARGQKIGLLQRMYSPTGSELSLVQRYADLAEVERIRAENLADSTFQTALAAANSLSRAPSINQLLEVLVPMAGPGAPAKYLRTTTFAQAPGKLPELVPLMQEEVKRRQAERPAGLRVDLFALDGPTLGVNVGYQSLADLESARRAALASQEYRDHMARVTALIQSPPRSQLFEWLIPVPPA